MLFLKLLKVVFLLSAGISASNIEIPCGSKKSLSSDTKIKRSYLAIFPDNNTGIECIEHEITGDNDCGFYVLGISRDQFVIQLLPLKENKQARQFLAPEIRHAFLSDEIANELKPHTWPIIHHAYQVAWTALENTMKSMKSPIAPPYPADLGLEERVEWLVKQIENDEEKEKLRKASRSYQEADTAIDEFCQNPSIFEHYINLYQIPKTVWLGYQSALLWARIQQVSLHIWRRSTKNTDVLTLIDAYTSPNPYHSVHMLHTSGFSHFNLLKEIKKRNLIDEREQIQSWNQTTANFPADKTLFELFSAQAEKTPAALAIISSQRRLTYRETYIQANQLAHALSEKGVLPNQLIGILMKKGWEQVVGCLGILGSGAAFLPVDPTWPPSRIQKVLELGEVEYILTQQIVLEAITENGVLRPYKCFAVDHEKTWESYPTIPLPRNQTSTDIAYVIFTSGSTGQPKGVVINHQGAVNTLVGMNQRFHVTATDKLLALSNLTH